MPWASASVRREHQREYMRAYRQRPEVQERERAWRREYKQRHRQRRPAEIRPMTPTLSDFDGAPPRSYVCEEGWLIIGDQAWTLEEWNTAIGAEERRKYAIRYDNDADRQEAIRRTKREYNRRKRGQAA